MNTKPITDFFKQKNVQNIIIIVLLLALLMGGSWIRLQNLPLLKDTTSGEYIPLALDPFYFLRIAETIENNSLTEFDPMRYPSLDTPYVDEISPHIIVAMYKIANTFNSDITLQYIDVISPVIFFVIGLLLFFFLILVLTESKFISILSAGFLTISQAYLYRTMAGFSDHEAIGMVGFFLALLIGSILIKYLEKNKGLFKLVLLSLLLAFASAFTIASWGGGAVFIFVIIPLTFFICWLIKSKERIELKNYLITYSIWVLFTIIFSLLFGFSANVIIQRFMIGTGTIITPFVLFFFMVDYLMIIKSNANKYRVLISGIITIIMGLIFYGFLIGNVGELISKLINRFLHPFGGGRVGDTIAENKEPYLIDWIYQTGTILFWMFYAGIIFVGLNISKCIKENKHKILFALSWIIFISGILFSRISSISIFNGVNFTSQAFYFLGALLFIIYSIWLYFNHDIKIKNELVLIAAWLILMLIAARGAIRLFFVIAPFVSFMTGYFIINFINYAKKSKEDLTKTLYFIGIIIIIMLLVMSSISMTKNVTAQAKYTGPSANLQWQKAMSWVRDNTNTEDIFVHWWDYGYWVQYLGQRATVTDGGHFIGFWDHLIGRYVLTTPNPNSALSFMKSHNVSYLLIDQTDLGKYPAYSSIGSDVNGQDRFSGIPILISDPKQIVETFNYTTIVYQGGFAIDEDIIYNDGNKEIFLPSQKAAIIGIILELNNQGSFNQPQGVFYYNNLQTKIPMRYVYYNGQIMDFKTGVDAVAYVLPQIYQNSQGGLQKSDLGTVIYLSPKVSKSLFAQLYLMNDVFNQYPTMKLAHSEDDLMIDSLNSQGANLNEFIYYNGFRGPIKIWGVDYPSNIISNEEFLRIFGEYAGFDNLQFIK